MKNIIKALIFISIVFLFNCSNSKEDDAKKAAALNEKAGIYNLGKIINDSLFPVTKLEHVHNTVKVEVIIPLYEMYYENRLNIIRDRIILLTLDHLKNVDSIVINTRVKEDPNPNEFLVLYDKKLIDKISVFYSTNKMYKDFNYYILKHFDGNKLAQYSIYLKILKKVDPKAVQTDDFIEIIYSYIDEVQQKSPTKISEVILKALKKMIIDMNEWKGYDKNEIDYFLNYKI